MNLYCYLKEHIDKLCLCLVILITFVYALYTGMHTMPFAEGWYTYYSQCINGGQVVYKDFDYLFPPLYIYLIAFITKIFGYNIFVLRVFGAVLFSGIASVLYLIFKEKFSVTASCVATFWGVFLMQSEVAQIFYDYIRVMDLCTLLTILFTIKSLNRESSGQLRSSFLIGFFAGLAFLIKQNLGVVLITFVLIVFGIEKFYLNETIKQMAKRICNTIIGFFMILGLCVIFLSLMGSLQDFYRLVFNEAMAAKGGLLAVLFGWISNHSSLFLHHSWFSVASPFLVILFITCLKKHEQKEDLIGVIAFSVLLFLLLIGEFKSKMLSQYFFDGKEMNMYHLFLSLFIALILFVVCSFYHRYRSDLKQQKEYFVYAVYLGFYVAIACACGMSGGLAEGQSYLAAFVICYVFDGLNFKFARILKYVLMCVILYNILGFAARKLLSPYYWWGMTEPEIWEARYESHLPLLKGISMADSTKTAYESIAGLVSSRTTMNDPIYCFPQIPLFYTLCNRHDPGVKSKVQWFDVSSDKTLHNDIQVIKRNPPKVIIIYDCPDYVYEEHQKMFRHGKKSGTLDMKRFLMNYARTHNYIRHSDISATKNNTFILFYK